MKKILIIICVVMTTGCTHMRWPSLNGRCPSDFPIKGNAESRLYHTPNSDYYHLTVPEVCFASEDIARRRGFGKAK
jgi:hypothetical protein